MPDKSSTVISYAAGASLAAVALIYVFGPNFTLDHDSTTSKKKTIVGLRNQANDCFINSVLQALAGLVELRVYLIRETHRRRIEDPRVYANLVQPPDGTEMAQWKLQGLQEGLVTHSLKEMLDALNERPIAKKAISPFPIVRALELAFQQRISRQQQDAQEFLQIVAERLKDEYHAGQRARLHARRLGSLSPASAMEGNDLDNDTGDGLDVADGDGDSEDLDTHGLDGSYAQVSASIHLSDAQKPDSDTRAVEVSKEDIVEATVEENVEGFPLEGKYESHIKCQSCGYTTKPRGETFCTLTLAVPQVTTTTLNACFDGIFKTEYIDDFKCEMCRLLQTKTKLEDELHKPTTSQALKAAALDSIEKLRRAIEHDPEQPPEGVELEDIRYAPRTRIAKTTRMVTFPKILAIHLSRSIYDVGKMTQKNSASVAFPEQLPLGGLMQQRKYKLLGLVTHRGGHNSGHYEAFRRQNAPSPYANSNTFQPSEVYCKTPTPASTPISTPEISALSTPDLLSVGSDSSSSSTPSLESSLRPRQKMARGDPPSPGWSKERDGETSSLRSVAISTKSALSRLAAGGSEKSGAKESSPVTRHAKKRKPGSEKWWRVSDEKVREAKTNEVLGMQKEVYLLFYELEKSE